MKNIDYPADYFDAVTVAFGVRNFENLDKGLGNPKSTTTGGDLSFWKPAVPQKFLYVSVPTFVHPFYNARGRLGFFQRQIAYQYLPDSCKCFFLLAKLSTIF